MPLREALWSAAALPPLSDDARKAQAEPAHSKAGFARSARRYDRAMISAIVLAAGTASRFGSCKQLVRVNGKPMLERTLDHLRASTVDDVVVVLGANAEEIRAAISLEDLRVVVNRDYAKGISTSIQAGLLAIDSDAAMIVLGDQPFVKPQTLDAIAEEFRRTGAKIVIPAYNGVRGNPVVVDRALFPEIMAIRGDVGCRALFGKHATHQFEVDDRGVIADVDTPADAVLE